MLFAYGIRQVSSRHGPIILKLFMLITRKTYIDYERASLSSCIPCFSVNTHNSFSWVLFCLIRSVLVTTTPHATPSHTTPTLFTWVRFGPIRSASVRFGPNRYFLSLFWSHPIRSDPIRVDWVRYCLVGISWVAFCPSRSDSVRSCPGIYLSPFPYGPVHSDNYPLLPCAFLYFLECVSVRSGLLFWSR